MGTELATWLQRDGTTVDTVTRWMRQRLDDDWRAQWDGQFDRLQRMYDSVGEGVYGIYNRALFAPVQDALNHEGLACAPRLPGNMDLSEERWGPEDFRERRMWALLLGRDGRPLGAVVTRFFHDHTQLRLPRPPTVQGLDETDHDRVRRIVLLEPTDWPPAG